MNGDDGYWDRPVRRYVVTGGRARASRNTLRPETLLAARTGRPLPVSASSEERELLAMCRHLLSLAEAAAHLCLPVSVVRVLAADLVDAGHLIARSGIRPAGGRPDRQLLLEVLDGLRKL